MMAVAWPDADFPRTDGGAADLFGAEVVVDADVFADEISGPRTGVAAGSTAPLGVTGLCAGVFGATDVTWLGAPAYTPPNGDAADVSWYRAPSGSVEGAAAGVVAALEIGGTASGSAGIITANAAAAIAGLGLAGDAQGVRGAAGEALAQCVALGLGGSAVARLVTQGTAAATISLAAFTAAAVAAQHPRYELRGQVRLVGNPVERRVRAYARSTGALLGQGDTTGGFFRISAGFAEIECTVLPIDLATDATDYEPPTANRVLCVLAEDDA